MSLGAVGSWMAQTAMQRAPLALAGMAGAAGLGFLASKGQGRGTIEGVYGAMSGGAVGGAAGATLGFAAGAGLMAAAMFSPTARPAVGKFLTKILASAPVQKFTASMVAAPVTGQTRAGMDVIKNFMKPFAGPHDAAANHLISLLKSKQASIAYGAVPGALAGGAIGGSLGYFTGAWRSGARLAGPQGAQY